MTRIITQGNYTGKLDRDGRLSIGYSAASKIRKEDEEHEIAYEKQFNSYKRTKKKYGKTIREEVKFFDGEVDLDRFIKSPELSQEKKAYGKNGITGYGKRVVRNSSLLLQDKIARHRLGFFTATMPNLGEKNLRLVISSWGEIVRKFFQELRREYGRQGCDFPYISVTEIQEKRFSKTGLPYPHLHWVSICKKPRSRGFVISANRIRQIWKRAICNSLRGSVPAESLDRISFNASVDAQVVKKSACAYLGKYISKGCAVVKSMQEKGFDEFPRQWWSCSKDVKKMFKDSVVRIHADMAFEIFMYFDAWMQSGMFEWGDDVFASISGIEQRVGVVAILYNDKIPLFREML